MKKLVVLLMIMFGCFAIAQTTDSIDTATTVVNTVMPDNPNVQNLEEFTLSKIWEGVKEFWSFLNWLFIVAFIVVSAVFNMYVSAENKGASLNWFRKVPMAVWVLLIGLILGLIFIFTSFKIYHH